MNLIVYEYHLKKTGPLHTSEENTLCYRISINKKTLNIIEQDEDAYPDWTLLEYQQCPHCPLKKEEYPRCPVAKNLYKLLTEFNAVSSVDVFDVQVYAEDRHYSKTTDIQDILRSLFGLIMATSPCPFMDFLKPMARFHLPFSTIEETIFRSLGNFLIEKYISEDHIIKSSVNEELTKNYLKVNEVNEQLIARIEHMISDSSSGDADQNAIVALDALAVLMTMDLKKNVSILSEIYSHKEGDISDEI
ncbi:MAG: hypothetical protein H6618_06900 [Deltaproteobacteria bacterium]|nr:hypothetical protein [Deltaproteobacteria bacterium]